MPGLNIHYSRGKINQDIKNDFRMKQKTLLHNYNYEEEISYADNNIIIGTTKYKSYPIQKHENDDYIIYIEGYIYNITSYKEIINKINNNFHDMEKLRKLILQLDGDYIFYFYNRKESRLIVINDPLGRLPLYILKENDSFFISREVSFLISSLESITVNEQIVAENLLFGTPLEDETLVPKIKRLKQGSIIDLISCKKSNILNYYKPNIEYKSNTLNIEQIIDVFSEACRNRYKVLKKDSEIIISLTGGLDARTVAVCLNNLNIPFSTTTFIDKHGKYAKDAKFAELIAEKLNVNWKLFRLKDKISNTDIEELYGLKKFLNNFEMAFILDYNKWIIKDHGSNISFWSGDEGNALLDMDMYPPMKLKSDKEVVEYIFQKLNKFMCFQIKSYLNIDINKIKEKLLKIIKSYPEKDFNNKFLHFYYFHYLFRVQYEGEDRNRCFFWTVAPMYSFPFVELILSIDSKYRKNHKLYRDFLNQLSPEIANIPNSNWGFSINKKRKLNYQAIKKKCFYLLPAFLRQKMYTHIFKKYNPKGSLKINRELLKLYIGKYKSSGSSIINNLSAKLLKDMHMNQKQFFSILTTVLSLSKIHNSIKRVKKII